MCETLVSPFARVYSDSPFVRGLAAFGGVPGEAALEDFAALDVGGIGERPVCVALADVNGGPQSTEWRQQIVTQPMRRCFLHLPVGGIDTNVKVARPSGIEMRQADFAESILIRRGIGTCKPTTAPCRVAGIDAAGRGRRSARCLGSRPGHGRSLRHTSCKVPRDSWRHGDSEFLRFTSRVHESSGPGEPAPG